MLNLFLSLMLAMPTVFAEKPWQRSFFIGNSVAGRPIRIQQLGDGADVVLFLSTIHGNEWAGTPLVVQLQRYLLQNPELLEGKTILIAPLSNPDGFIDGFRGNRNRVDLNRNFPSYNYGRGFQKGTGPVSEPESTALLHLINEFQPKRVIALHQPFNCVDYDGPSKALAEQMAKSANLQLKQIGSRSGSLGSYVGKQLQKEIITFELPYNSNQKSAEFLWKRYGEAMIYAVIFPSTQIDTSIVERSKSK